LCSKKTQPKKSSYLSREREREREGHAAAAAAAASPTILFQLEACFSFILACVKEMMRFWGVEEIENSFAQER
jgi:hypothetical protein